MSNLCFDRIGSIFKTSYGTYTVSQIPRFGGPFSSAAEYYVAWANLERPNTELKPPINRCFPDRVAAAAGELSSQNGGPFSLVHPDFGNHNILVNDEYDIVSVVDWGGANVLPLEFSAIFPASLQAIHDIFWMGGPFDNAQTRLEHSERKNDQLIYVAFTRTEEIQQDRPPRLSLELGGVRATVADCLPLYSEGNQNPLCRIIDPVDR